MRFQERRAHVNTGAYARMMAVRVLALAASAGFGTMAYLSIRSGALVQGFSEATTGAFSALVALLARTESGEGPQIVRVANPPTEPVPVEETKP